MRALGSRIAALSLGVVATTLAGCSDDTAGPEPVADQLVAALAAQDLADVPFRSRPKDFADVVAALDGMPVSVTLGEVEEEDDRATARLGWTWDLRGDAWSYETSAGLVRDGDTWSVEWAPSIVEPSLEDGEVLDLDTLLPRRGEILGARRQPIVTERDVVRFGIDKSKVGQARAVRSAESVATMLGVDAAPYTRRVRAAGPKAFVEAIVLRAEDARGVPAAYDDVPGAAAIGSTLPLAPTREFAAPLLGSVGPATAELIEKSEGALREGDVVGLSGLQERYDDQLRGTPGVEVEAVDARGQERELFEAMPVDGEPLALTLDVDLQRRAEEILAGTVPASAIVAIRPSTGDILAAASGPGSKGLNTATYGQYAPGSTMKVVTALALLRSGLSPQSTIACPPSTVVDGKTFENYDDYPASSLGTITLRDAVAQSCNTALIGQRDRLSRSALSEAAAALGLGVDHDLGFPAYFGQVPPPASETEAAADLIGQGKVLASPMAMAAVAASVQAGRAVLPRLVVDHDAAQTEPAQPLTSAEAGQLRALMRAVVTEGSGSFLGRLPGEIGAKTGTAEYGEPGADGSLATHAWMIAFRDDLAVAVFVETGESGSQTAGPLLEAFLSAG